MFISFIILIFSIFNIYFTQIIDQEVRKRKVVRKGKSVTCTYLANSPLLPLKNIEKKLKEFLIKDKNFKKEYKSKETVSEFMSAICFYNISEDLYVDALRTIEKSGEIDISKNPLPFIFVIILKCLYNL